MAKNDTLDPNNHATHKQIQQDESNYKTDVNTNTDVGQNGTLDRNNTTTHNVKLIQRIQIQIQVQMLAKNHTLQYTSSFSSFCIILEFWLSSALANNSFYPQSYIIYGSREEKGERFAKISR